MRLKQVPQPRNSNTMLKQYLVCFEKESMRYLEAGRGFGYWLPLLGAVTGWSNDSIAGMQTDSKVDEKGDVHKNK
jgi:hypothetical protein